MNLSSQESGQETSEDCCVINLCRNMYIRHGSISYLSGLVHPRKEQKEKYSRLRLFIL